MPALPRSPADLQVNEEKFWFWNAVCAVLDGYAHRQGRRRRSRVWLKKREKVEQSAQRAARIKGVSVVDHSALELATSGAVPTLVQAFEAQGLSPSDARLGARRLQSRIDRKSQAVLEIQENIRNRMAAASQELAVSKVEAAQKGLNTLVTLMEEGGTTPEFRASVAKDLLDRTFEASKVTRQEIASHHTGSLMLPDAKATSLLGAMARAAVAMERRPEEIQWQEKPIPDDHRITGKSADVVVIPISVTDPDET